MKFKAILCDHKCHDVGLNPWVKDCPICGCPNRAYDIEAKVPDWLKEFAPCTSGAAKEWGKL